MASVVAVLATLMLTVAPTDSGLLSFTQVGINTSAGDQYDPHVDGDLAAYSARPGTDEEIRYYRFSSAADVVCVRASFTSPPD